jgi:hypothetical protein
MAGPAEIPAGPFSFWGMCVLHLTQKKQDAISVKADIFKSKKLMYA